MFRLGVNCVSGLFTQSFFSQKLGQGEQTRCLTSPEPSTQSELLWFRLPVVCRQQLLQKTSPPALLGGF